MWFFFFNYIWQREYVRDIWWGVVSSCLSALPRREMPVRRVSLSVFEVLWECRPFDRTRSFNVVLFTDDLIRRRRTMWKTRTRGLDWKSEALVCGASVTCHYRRWFVLIPHTRLFSKEFVNAWHFAALFECFCALDETSFLETEPR